MAGINAPRSCDQKDSELQQDNSLKQEDFWDTESAKSVNESVEKQKIVDYGKEMILKA